MIVDTPAEVTDLRRKLSRSATRSVPPVRTESCATNDDPVAAIVDVDPETHLRSFWEFEPQEPALLLKYTAPAASTATPPGLQMPLTSVEIVSAARSSFRMRPFPPSAMRRFPEG